MARTTRLWTAYATASYVPRQFAPKSFLSYNRGVRSLLHHALKYQYTVEVERMLSADAEADPTPNTPLEQSSLDLRYLAMLHAKAQATAPGFVRELIDMFLADTAPQLAILRQAVEAQDTSTCAFTAHRLVSSCAAIGAVRLTSLLKDIEFLAQTAELAILPGQLAVVEAEYQHIEAVLAQSEF